MLNIDTRPQQRPPREPSPASPARFDDIRRWADARNLIDGSDPKSQLLKTMEEMGELASGISKRNLEMIKDGIGDVVVTLVIIAAQLDLTVEECIEHAWQEIKDRRGLMVGGVFIKEVDLHLAEEDA